MKKKIFLSPSNQDGNQYAYGHTNECEQCNRIADYARIALERCGFEVRKAPKGQNMNVTIGESNIWGADLHIPIHTNAITNTGTGSAAGTIVFIYNNDPENWKIARPIYNNVQESIPGGYNYGVRVNSELAELNSTNAVAVYVEVDFHDNPTIAKYIVENVEKIGEAIARGVCEGYGVEYVPATSQTIYRIQVGAFKDKKYAEAYLKKVKDAGFNTAFIVECEV